MPKQHSNQLYGSSRTNQIQQKSRVKQIQAYGCLFLRYRWSCNEGGFIATQDELGKSQSFIMAMCESSFNKLPDTK